MDVMWYVQAQASQPGYYAVQYYHGVFVTAGGSTNTLDVSSAPGSVRSGSLLVPRNVRELSDNILAARRVVVVVSWR